MLTKHLVALFTLLPLALSAPQGQCWGRHGRSCSSSISEVASPTTVDAGTGDVEPSPSAGDDGTTEPIESDPAAGSGSDNDESDGGSDGSDTDATSAVTEVSSASATRSATAPAASTKASSGGSTGGSAGLWTPSLSDTFVVHLENTPMPSSAASVYIVDLAHTADQIAAYKADGKRVICYFSAGAWDPYRDDKLLFDTECYCGKGQTSRDAETGVCSTTDNKQDAWDAWWFDLTTPACVENVQSVHLARMKAAKDKGCDGIDPDNVDSYGNRNSYGNTMANQFDFNMWLATTAHENKLAIDLKNAPKMLQISDEQTAALVGAFDFNVVESCHLYGDPSEGTLECAAYQPFLDAGKPQIQLEYADKEPETGVKFTQCDPAKEGVSQALYTTTLLDSNDITVSCLN